MKTSLGFEYFNLSPSPDSLPISLLIALRIVRVVTSDIRSILYTGGWLGDQYTDVDVSRCFHRVFLEILHIRDKLWRILADGG